MIRWFRNISWWWHNHTSDFLVTEWRLLVSFSALCVRFVWWQEKHECIRLSTGDHVAHAQWTPGSKKKMIINLISFFFFVTQWLTIHSKCKNSYWAVSYAVSYVAILIRDLQKTLNSSLLVDTSPCWSFVIRAEEKVWECSQHRVIGDGQRPSAVGVALIRPKAG